MITRRSLFGLTAGAAASAVAPAKDVRADRARDDLIKMLSKPFPGPILIGMDSGKEPGMAIHKLANLRKLA